MSLRSLALHPSTRVQLESYVEHPFHALILSGKVGVGLRTIALSLAHGITDAPYVTSISPDKNSISVDAVRELYSLTRTKSDKPRVICIDDAETMGHEAQNALLKLLEEPSSHIFFILTSHAEQHLLETILSRVEHIEVKSISSEASNTLLPSAVAGTSKGQQVLFLANGRPAEIYRLCADESYFNSQVVYVRNARTFITKEKIEMLTTAFEYTTRESAIAFVSTVGNLLLHALYKNPEPKLTYHLSLVDETTERLVANGHIKLQLAWLVMRW